MKNICLLLFCAVQLVSAQKIIEKSLVNPKIQAISIDAKHSFELSVQTAPGSELVCEATIDGEYKRNLFLNLRESGGTILVSADFPPDYKRPNDKLAAHKVVSIALKITLPERLSVRIYGTDCDVSVKGSYNHLKITLNDGRCDLVRISGNVEVATQSGSISVTAENAEIKADSKYGEVRGLRSVTGAHRYDLRSVTGDIAINGMMEQ
ncbi:MAG TPA: DUF4097 family beta strand repeat-containing protein [Pricia sp.]|nr:DUF4097 family beta strand repeat-containing protein [Pricia sp.]